MERRLGAGAVLIDGPRDQFLAGAALAVQQHRHVLVRDPADRLVDLAHCRAAAKDGVAAIVLGERLCDRGRRTHQAGQLQRLADDAPQLLRVERLEQVVVGPLLHRRDCRIRRGDTGDEDDGDPRVNGTNTPIKLQPGAIGQTHVQEDDVRQRCRQLPRSIRAVAGYGNRHAEWRQGVGCLGQDEVRVVIDEQEPGHGPLRRIALTFGARARYTNSPSAGRNARWAERAEALAVTVYL
jgi:hypothetical protein